VRHAVVLPPTRETLGTYAGSRPFGSGTPDPYRSGGGSRVNSRRCAIDRRTALSAMVP